MLAYYDIAPIPDISSIIDISPIHDISSIIDISPNT